MGVREAIQARSDEHRVCKENVPLGRTVGQAHLGKRGRPMGIGKRPFGSAMVLGILVEDTLSAKKLAEVRSRRVGHEFVGGANDLSAGQGGAMMCERGWVCGAVAVSLDSGGPALRVF